MIKKSYFDKNEYDYKILSNGIKLFIIKSENINNSAISVLIKGGSNYDYETLGIAHFIEHLLFLGNKKFPNIDVVSKIASLNGYCNAYTTYDHTNYQLSINPDSFFDSFEYFINMFIDPLFSIESIEKEKNAVDNEYKLNIQNDYHRMAIIFNELTNEEENYYKFSCGNLETFNIKDIREKILNYFNKYYSANNISIILYHTHIDDKIINLLEQIKNNDFINTKIPEYIFKNNNMEVIKIQSISKNYLLNINIPLIVHDNLYLNSPFLFLIKMITSSHENSFCNILYKLNYINDISFNFSCYDNNNNIYILEFIFELNNLGHLHYHEIINLFYNHINFLKNQGFNKQLYHDFRVNFNVNFNLKSNTDQMLDYICKMNILFGFNKSNVKHLLFYNKFIIKYHDNIEKIYMDYLNEIMKCNCKIILSTDLNDIKDYKIEKYYDVKYKIINDEKIKLSKKKYDFNLLKKNNLLTNCFFYIEDECLKNPSLIKLNDSSLWFHYNKNFYINFYIIFTCDHIISSLLNNLYSSLFILCIIESLKFDLIIYSNALLNIDIYIKKNKLIINIFGYNNNIEHILDIIKKIFNIQITQEIFNKCLNTFSTNLKNKLFNLKSSNINDLFESKINKYSYNLFDKYKNLYKINYNDFINFSTHLKYNLNDYIFFINGLIDKNYLIKKLNNFTNKNNKNNQKKLNINNFINNTYEEYYEFEKVNKENKNITLAKYYHIGKIFTFENWIKTFCLLNIFNIICIDKFFSIMRTEKQLGYVAKVAINNSNTYEDPYITHLFVIESGNSSKEKLLESYEDFFIRIKKFLNDLSDEEFNVFIKNYEQSLDSLKKTSFEDKIDYNLLEILNGKNQFDFNIDQINIIKTFKKNDLILFYETYYKNFSWVFLY